MGFRWCSSAFFWVILCSVVLVVFNCNVEASRTLKQKSSVLSMATESLAAIIEKAYSGPSHSGRGH
nr:hypothetical protein PHAVU_002G053500g [Ipomoea batatas]GMD53161.1 hypothetical protein PHAVU_002G053500g [Ipomoea batatas]GMD90369.1 hypothetical protein PHAVU_002G053500g [Ipomoea batatas]GME07637.1 hypothetical protein PHAVU_002G053500g [Ipomoea batatas]